MKKFVQFVLLCLLLNSSKINAGWDTEYWQRLQWTVWENDCFEVDTQGEARFNHGCSRAFFYRLSECFTYKPFRWLNLGVNYTYIWDKPRGSDHFMWRQRLELEIDPSLTLPNDLKIAWMNMIMFIKEQGDPKIHYTFRHRVSLIYPLQGWSNLNSIQCSEEVFYHFLTHRFSQSRFTPIQLNYTINDDVDLSIFLIIRNFETNMKWWRSFVLGTELDF